MWRIAKSSQFIKLGGEIRSVKGIYNLTEGRGLVVQSLKCYGLYVSHQARQLLIDVFTEENNVFGVRHSNPRASLIA